MASNKSQRPPSSFGTFVLGLACLAVFAAGIVLWVKCRAPKTDSVAAERGAARLKKRGELEKEWTEKLTTVTWVDKEKGIAQIPIDDAIKATVTDLKAKKVAQSAVKVPAPLPPPVVDPKSTEPPPPALPSAPQGTDLIHFPIPAAAPAPAASAAPATPALASSLPARPPLINWTESK